MQLFYVSTPHFTFSHSFCSMPPLQALVHTLVLHILDLCLSVLFPVLQCTPKYARKCQSYRVTDYCDCLCINIIYIYNSWFSFCFLFFGGDLPPRSQINAQSYSYLWLYLGLFLYSFSNLTRFVSGVFNFLPLFIPHVILSFLIYGWLCGWVADHCCPPLLPILFLPLLSFFF